MTSAPAVVGWAERHQVALYVAAIAGAVVVGLLAPAAEHAESLINPAIAALLFVTFLGVPFAAIGRAARDARFLGSLLVLNFLLVPVVVFGLSRFVAADEALLVGVLLVLLTPCIDYVIVFTDLAGGAHERLLAAAPILMLLQMLLLPAYLWALAGGDVVDVVDPEPFVEALVVLIVIPLAAAAAVQALARRSPQVERAHGVAAWTMVPLMMIVLATVIASQVATLERGDLSTVLKVLPIYVAFLLVMAPLGRLVAIRSGLDVPAARALTFSGATRNSLVVLPLALALPAELALVPLVVVTQTLVELVGMVVYTRVIPRILTDPVEVARSA